MLIGVPYLKVQEIVKKHNGWLQGELAHFTNQHDYAAFLKEMEMWYAFYTEPRAPGVALQ